MRKIRQMIVVEGRSDTATLRRYFDCDTIETGGDHVDAQTIDRIAHAARERGVIVFTDPDSSGNRIRRILDEHIEGLQHAFIEKSKARTDKKVGVEHAAREDLEESLAHLVTFDNLEPTLSWSEFIDAGMVGDAARREKVCVHFHIGKCNAKTCFKRLNQMGVDGAALRQAVKEGKS